MSTSRIAGAIAVMLAGLAAAGCGGAGADRAASPGSLASFADATRMVQCSLRSAEGEWLSVAGYGALAACEDLRQRVDQEVPWRLRRVEDRHGTLSDQVERVDEGLVELCEYTFDSTVPPDGASELAAVVEGFNLHGSGGAMCSTLDAGGWAYVPPY